MKQKTCKQCKGKFTPERSLQVCCNYQCAIDYAQAQRQRKALKAASIERKAYREAKVKAKSRSEWIKDVQVICNRYIRMRDAEDGCISCDKDKYWNGQWHASHYYATSIRPNLRFNELNIHKSCSVCNAHMHGNLTPYRVKLIEKIGKEEMEKLDADRSPLNLTIPDLQELKKEYAQKIKNLQSIV